MNFKKFQKKYRHVIELALVVSGLVALCFVGLPVLSAFVILALYQLMQHAMSKESRNGYCYDTPILTPAQVKEFGKLCEELKEFGTHIPGLKDLSNVEGGFAAIKRLPGMMLEMRGEIKRLRKNNTGSNTGVYRLGNKLFVSDDCAKALSSVFVLGCARIENGLESLVPDEGRRKNLIALAASNLGMETRTALTTTEIPVPTLYVPQIVELVFAYGAARNFATVFPLGSGTVKLPRLKAGEDDFSYLGAGAAGMSQPVGEKKVTAELVTFTANKFGGLIRIPMELEEDTMIPIGQFLARYIARQLAKGEDKTLFLADGTAAYANQTGVGNYCAANPDFLLKLDAGKTKVSDITLEDFRSLRGKVSAAVLGKMAANGETEAAYYLSPTLEPLLCSFNKYPNFVVFKNENGKPTLDGYPVRWIGVSATNNGIAQPEAFAAFFGDLSYIYLGERGAVRVEVSKEVFFATDELAMRVLERIDVEILAVDAMAALQIGAAA